MSVTAPPPPTRVPTPPPDVREPDLPPVLELLIASRPEREGRIVASSVVTALAIHLLLILVLLITGPLGGRWIPSLPIAGNPDERTVTLLLPGTDVGGAGRATPPPSAQRATEAPLVTPRRIPTSIPAIPAPGAAAPGQPGAGGQGQGARGAGTGAGEAGEGGAAYGNSAARFRPKSWDRRLWEEPDRLLPMQSDADRAVARVQNKLDAVNDSAAAVAEAARKGTDWTIKDKNGKSWGVSPGKLHLGDITLPLPLGFQSPNGRRDEFEKNQANWDDIQRSASQAEIRHTFDERVKAIRQRKEKEKQDAQKNPPSTTTTSSDH